MWATGKVPLTGAFGLPVHFSTNSVYLRPGV